MVRVRYEWPGTGTKLVRSDIIRTRFVPRTPTRDEISTKYGRIKHESLKLCGWKVRVWYDPGRTSKLTKHSYHFRTTSGTNVVRNDMMYIRVPFVPGGMVRTRYEYAVSFHNRTMYIRTRFVHELVRYEPGTNALFGPIFVLRSCHGSRTRWTTWCMERTRYERICLASCIRTICVRAVFVPECPLVRTRYEYVLLFRIRTRFVHELIRYPTYMSPPSGNRYIRQRWPETF